MTREQLAHILRASARIANDPQILVIGSQAILASYPETELPEVAWLSIEADIAFFNDVGRALGLLKAHWKPDAPDVRRHYVW